MSNLPDLPTAEQIEAAANAAGVSMSELCAMTGIAFTTWWRWRNHSSQPRLGTVQALIEAIRVVERQKQKRP